MNMLGDRVLGHAYTGATGHPLCQIPPPRKEIRKWLMEQRHRSQTWGVPSDERLEADKDQANKTP